MKSATCLRPTSGNRGAHPTHITGASSGKQTPVGLTLLKEVPPIRRDRPDQQIPVQEVVHALTAGLTQVNAAMAGGSMEVTLVVRVVWLVQARHRTQDCPVVGPGRGFFKILDAGSLVWFQADPRTHYVIVGLPGNASGVFPSWPLQILCISVKFTSSLSQFSSRI